MKGKRLSKALAAAGVASRRACEQLIFDECVTVNGSLVTVPQTLVDWEKDTIAVNGQQLKQEEQKKYYVLNKPLGYICSSKHGNSQKLVVNLFKDEKLRLFTVGRLDTETSGLLIVTNDGHFSNQVIHPSAGLTKEYIAKVVQEIMPHHLQKVAEGAVVEGVHVKPVSVSKVRKGTIKVVVMEGKKHEVRILMANAGLDVKELARVRIGNLHLGTLPRGKYRELTDREREIIFE